MTRIVVIDSSPLIGLAMVNGLQWLPKLFGTVFLPDSVRQEVLPGKTAPGEQAIADAIGESWIKVWPEPIEPLLDIDLDAGETDCINLGLRYEDQALLIMDEPCRSCCGERERAAGYWYGRNYWHSQKTRIDSIGTGSV